MLLSTSTIITTRLSRRKCITLRERIHHLRIYTVINVSPGYYDFSFEINVTILVTAYTIGRVLHVVCTSFRLA